MHVDWITVAAQLVNFLILVWLLKRFLYAPIIDLMARRQARITEQVERASQRESDAQQTQSDYEQRLAAFEASRAQAMAAMEREVESERSVLRAAMRDEMILARTDWHEALQRERERFVKSLSSQSVRLAFDLARRTLIDLADVALETRVLDRFIAELENMDADRRALLGPGPEPFLVETAFVLDDKARERVRDALAALGYADRAIEFRHSEGAGCGVELIAGHARVGWSVQSHLTHLEREADDALASVISRAVADAGA